jgi:Polyketide cyclase / dehydrase and lipid transport
LRAGPMMLGGQVDFAVAREFAYAYLADPRNRPEWQGSLKNVEMIDEGEPRVGMRWRDHTVARIVPDMQITAMVPSELWAETGHWRGISAVLELGFEPTATGCVVEVRFRVRGRGLLVPAGWLATGAGVLPVMSDVKRAARILESRES